MTSTFKKVLLSFVACSLLLTPCFADDASDDDTGSNDQQSFHLSDGLDLVSTLKIQYDKPRIVVKSVYPQLATYDNNNVDSDSPDNNQDDDQVSANSIYDNFNQMVFDLVQQSIAEFKTRVNANTSFQQILKKSQIRNDFYVDYDAAYIRPRQTPILSIRFSIQGMISSAEHPYHQHFVLNYDLDNGKEILLTDLFQPNTNYLIILSNYASSRLAKDFRNSELLAKGTAPSTENFKNWNLKANGLLITFDEGQVAARHYGAQTVLIPYSVLKDIISPDSPIAKCTISKKHCMGNQLLTGGFIDQA